MSGGFDVGVRAWQSPWPSMHGMRGPWFQFVWVLAWQSPGPSMHGMSGLLFSVLLSCAAMADFDRTLDIALLHTFRRRPALRYPWETNPMIAPCPGSGGA